MLNIFSVVSVRTVCKVRGSRTSNSWHCACGRAGGPTEKARLPESGGRRFGWSLEVTACDRRAPVVHTTHRGTVYVRCVPLALLLVLAVHPCACAHGTKVHVNFERRSHTSTKPRNKVQLAARPLQRRALRARTAQRPLHDVRTVPSPILRHAPRARPLGPPAPALHSAVLPLHGELDPRASFVHGAAGRRRRRARLVQVQEEEVEGMRRVGHRSSPGRRRQERRVGASTPVRAALHRPSLRQHAGVPARQLLIDSTQFCIYFF
jgi:hypothetical protein